MLFLRTPRHPVLLLLTRISQRLILDSGGGAEVGLVIEAAAEEAMIITVVDGNIIGEEGSDGDKRKMASSMSPKLTLGYAVLVGGN